MTGRTAIFLSFIFFSSCALCHAQISPGGALQQSTQTLEELRREQELRNKKEQEKSVVREASEAAAEATPEDENVIVFVKSIVVERASLVSEHEIRAITGKLEGREVRTGELNRMLQEINALFRSKGYLAQAVFPDQDASTGIIRVWVVEGRFGQTVIEGNRYTGTSYIRNRFSHKSGDPINLNTLEKELLHFNITNDVRLEAELRPGKETGITDLYLKALEPPNYSATLFSDNAGRIAWGLYRFGLTLKDPSVFGYRDVLALTALGAEGLFAESISYSIPITKSGTRFGIRYDRNDIDIIGGPLIDIQSRGNASDLAFSLTHPLVVTRKYQFEVLAELHGKRSETILTEAVRAAVGIDRFAQDVRSFVAGWNLQVFDSGGVWVVHNEFTKGFREFGGDDNYFKYNLLFLRQQRINDETFLILKGGGQATPNQLLPGTEQFFIGGISTIPGYPEGLLNGDNGYYWGAELNFPLFPKNWWSGFSLREKVKGIAFVDHGGAFSFRFDESIDHRDFLSSAGFGFLLNFSKYFSGKVLIGFPLDERPEVHSHPRVHFFIQSNLF